MYQSPNNAPSSNVLDKRLDSALSPALSGTEAALTSKLFASRSDSGAGAEVHGLSLNESDEDTDHDRRGKLPETETLARPFGFEEYEARMGSNLGFNTWPEAQRGFGRGSVGERENAALCIFPAKRLRIEISEGESERASESENERERERALESPQRRRGWLGLVKQSECAGERRRAVEHL